MTNVKTVQVITAFLALLLLLANNIATAENTCDSSIVVKNPSGDQQFGILYKTFSDGQPLQITPRALAIDSKDNIYVGDSVKYRVMKFDSAGKFLFEIKLQPASRSMQRDTGPIIQDLGTDDDANVYVSNLFEERVEIYDQNGKYKESVSPGDNKQKGVFTKASKGKFSKYMYEFNSYIPDKKLPGRILHSITVSDVSGKTKKVISKCNGVELNSDEDGEIYSFDYNGSIYTFDPYLNVVKINPFK
jgi:murein DD-endopeptidase MepM/ murein hydrolase activator NlpD